MGVIEIDDRKQMKFMKTEILRFMMGYKFALDEINTKIDILKQEFQIMHDYNPIEHVKSRIKSPKSILKKVKKRGYDFSLPTIKEKVRDIAGVRITCSFISDIYEISNMLQNQKDIEVVEVKDYIKNPKPNGYQSLHLIIKIPIFMSDREERVYVEIQIRTIAMDFWASLEHKIYYKYNKEVPQKIKDDLKDAAISSTLLDRKMENIHKEMDKIKESVKDEDDLQELLINNEKFHLPYDFLTADFMGRREDN
ncbi:GTP pyrophosphokinase family protein [Heyndrickxia sporothermodurans]|uniref:GTP pyrophosphokinase family protein n=1 Tax=Heyndrickxia sporothermodurans TaxID=46224 RepID=A0AB37HEP6_9BACI|nr:GTP pyrophosphokinase family protein [Heyndrickxia sporothermodurans]MBL5768176.1 GTP pyrophosphokinase family protein [Heyndrickxia sporothermodurans]MBL5771829.1 GTP pyrophosphokinase family protein [Heyndrickxia sporothermodurans]MBL5775458.1 GTP pyrophosphokinase family protein [Heyndrickxia sporothermodurans]MBL5778770.1 GTP pyrophosphokinase family protein [Heyndrickxia sporothermodurans]MBL5782545.1 GTP pyrophosphokinase family protein [Heyndrickxia sporothermodurans]